MLVRGFGLGINQTLTGILKAAADNTWTMYAQFFSDPLGHEPSNDLLACPARRNRFALGSEKSVLNYSCPSGKYVVLLPLVYVGTVTSLGIGAVYLAVVAETWSSAAVTGYRFVSGTWKEVSRAYRPSPAQD